MFDFIRKFVALLNLTDFKNGMYVAVTSNVYFGFASEQLIAGGGEHSVS